MGEPTPQSCLKTQPSTHVHGIGMKNTLAADVDRSAAPSTLACTNFTAACAAAPPIPHTYFSTRRAACAHVYGSTALTHARWCVYMRARRYLALLSSLNTKHSEP